MEDNFSFSDYLSFSPSGLSDIVSPSRFFGSQVDQDSAEKSLDPLHSTNVDSVDEFVRDTDGFVMPNAPATKASKIKPGLHINTSIPEKNGSLINPPRMSPRLGSPITPTGPTIGVFIDSPRSRRGFGEFYVSPRLSSPRGNYVTRQGLSVNPGRVFAQEYHVEPNTSTKNLKRNYDIAEIASPLSPNKPTFVQKEVKLERRVVLGRWKKRLKESIEHAGPRGGKSKPEHILNQEILKRSQAVPQRFATVLTAEDVSNSKDLSVSDEVENMLKGFALNELAPAIETKPMSPLIINSDLIGLLNNEHLETFPDYVDQYDTTFGNESTTFYDWNDYPSHPVTSVHPLQVDSSTLAHANHPTRIHPRLNSTPTIISNNFTSSDSSLAQQLTNIVPQQSESDKPFNCPFAECGHEFSRRHDLLRHLRIHTQEKPYRCEKCFKAFTRLDALKRHTQVSMKYGGQCRVKRGRVPKSVMESIRNEDNF